MQLRTLILVTLGCCFHTALAQTCNPNPPGPGQRFPDLFEITEGSYMFTVEANLPDKSTEYITEFVDIRQQRSRVEVTRNGTKKSYLALENENELFIIEGDMCTSMNLTNSYLRQDLHWMTKDPSAMDVNDDYIGFGPSFLIRAAYKVWKTRSTDIGVDSNFTTVRQMSCAKWTWCYGEDEITFYFTDELLERPYGLVGIPVPVRMTVKGKDLQTRTYEFFRMIPKVWSKRMDKKLQIPATLGCKRLSAVDTAPDYNLNDVYLEGEVIYTPSNNNPKEYSYVTYLTLANRRYPKMMLVQWTPWTTKTNALNVSLPGDNTIRIFTPDFTYEIDKTKSTCQTFRTADQDSGLSFSLPDGSNLDDINEDLLFLAGDGQEYKLLGKTVERGIPAVVYEKIKLDELGLAERIITRYYMDKSILLMDDLKVENAPMKVVLWDTSMEPNEFSGELVINIFSFQPKLTRVHQLFDVSACSKEEKQSMGFQITFPLGDIPASEVLPELPILRNDLPSLLASKDILLKGTMPLRIPKVQVDLIKDYIYVTGIILERPQLFGDFTMWNESRRLKDGPNVATPGVLAPDDCAKTCLELSSCQYLSYCGAVCKVATGPITVEVDTEITEPLECTFYSNDAPKNSMWTMEQVSRALASAVDSRSLSILLPKTSNPVDVMELLADSYKKLPNGFKESQDRQTGDLSRWFNVYLEKSRLKTGIMTSVGEMTLEECKSACSMKGNCESLSYCLYTNECTLAIQTGTEIDKNDIENNDQCIILSRNYLSHYVEHQGLVVTQQARETSSAQTAEECAKGCSQESGFDCQSFDFCDGEELRCLMHQQQFIGGKDQTQMAKKETCRHFARNYLHHFQSYSGQVMSNNNNRAGMIADDVTAEECARLCNDKRDAMPCQGFDYCGEPAKAKYRCTLRKSDTQPFDSNSTCTSFTWRSKGN